MIYTLTVARLAGLFFQVSIRYGLSSIRSFDSRIKLHSHFSQSVEKVHELCQL